jgi:hypothetical protein
LLIAPFVANSQATALSTGTCSKIGATKTVSGIKYICSKSGQQLVWAKDSAGSNSTYFRSKRIGDGCNVPGLVGSNGGGLFICSGGKVHYAMRSDIPAAPVGGYTKRPSWYPTLAQMTGLQAEPTCKPSSIKFTYSVMPLDQIAPIIPYGAVIGDHVTPIDHGYISIKSLYKEQSDRTDADWVTVVAPAAGTIIEVGSLGSPTSNRVIIRHGCNLVSVYMVLNKLTGVLAPYAAQVAKTGSANINLPIKAGQEFGRQRDNPLDFNIWDGTQWLTGLAEPFSYLYGEAWKPYTADPLPFFTSDIRAAYEGKMQRTTTPRFGKIDYDVVGAASGNWFLTGTIGYSGQSIAQLATATIEIPGGSVAGKNTYAYGHLSISPDAVDTVRWIFSTGWWQDPAGDPKQWLMTIAAGQPNPDKLTASSGVVVYKLNRFSFIEPAGTPPRGSSGPLAIGYTLSTGDIEGVVALQVNANGTLSMEVNPSMTSTSQFTGFTAAKRTYHR